MTTDCLWTSGLSGVDDEVLDAGELLGHLVAQDDYTTDALSGGTTVFLRALHARAHEHMANDLAGGIPELTGSAERLFTAALETVKPVLALDRDLVRRLVARCAEALHVLCDAAHKRGPGGVHGGVYEDVQGGLLHTGKLSGLRRWIGVDERGPCLRDSASSSPGGSGFVERIAVIGCGGSGKSHLARRLGAALSLPVTHLDALYYDTSWNPLAPEAFAALQRDLVAAPAWVIDGNYASSLPIRLAAADAVVFLDLPALTCLWGIAQRRLRGSPERITIEFLRYVLHYRRAMRPRVRQLLATHASHTRVVTLTSRHSTSRWLRHATSLRGATSTPDEPAPGSSG